MSATPEQSHLADKPPVSWDELDFAGFARLAGDSRLSKYEKIGFPDSYRSGFEAAIFADVRAKLPRLAAREQTVLDIGPGCSDLPGMLIDLCAEQGHQLVLVDSPEMLAQLPGQPFIEKRPGMFPQCRTDLASLRGRVDAILCYSVLHYIYVDSGRNLDRFVDAVIELLAPGGEALIGDIPNASKRRRFFSSDAGIAFHRAFTGTNTLPPPVDDTNRIDDGVILGMLERARAAGADAYWLPQPPSLPMANRREDILIRRPG